MNASKRSSYRRLGRALNLALIFALLAGFFYYADTEELFRVLAGAHLQIFILAVAASAVITFFMSFRLWLIIRKQGIEMPLLRLVGVNMGIRFYSFFSPISSVGSIMRWSRLIPAGKSAEGLAALGVNRVFEIVLAIAASIFWGFTAAKQDVLDSGLLLIYLGFLVAVLWLTFRVSSSISIWAGQRESSAVSDSSTWAYRALKRFFGSFSLYRTLSTSEMALILASAIVADIVGLLAYLLVALSIDIPISFVDLGWVRALGLLAAWTPFTLPGGFGMREISTVVLMTGLGIGPEQATAFSLLLYARSVIIALIGGGIEFVFHISRLAD